MPQPDHITALDIEDRDNLDERRQKYLRILQERLGFVPNVIQAYSFDNAKLATFADFFSELMGAESGLSRLEREMIAVVVSSINRCFYCLTAHGAAVRQRHQPGQRASRGGVVVLGGAPHLQVDVLRAFLAVSGVPQNAGDQAEHPGTGLVIERREGVDIPTGHLAQQCVEFGGHER